MLWAHKIDDYLMHVPVVHSFFGLYFVALEYLSNPLFRSLIPCLMLISKCVKRKGKKKMPENKIKPKNAMEQNKNNRTLHRIPRFTNTSNYDILTRDEPN